MGQTGTIFFALLVGFLVFITLRGEMGAYIAVVLGSGTAETPEQAAKRTAADLANSKAEASRLNDLLKPIGGLPNIHT